MSTLVEKTNPIRAKRLLAKHKTYREAKDYQAFFFMPDKEEWRQLLIDTMYNWVKSDKSLEIEQFCMEYYITRSNIYRWADQYEDIKEALNHIRFMLASRRRIGALVRKYDKDVVYKDLHRYDPEQLEINKYWADLKQKEQEGSKAFTIVMEPAKETDIKPREVKGVSDEKI